MEEAKESALTEDCRMTFNCALYSMCLTSHLTKGYDD
jgi:hypothetical protein